MANYEAKIQQLIDDVHNGDDTRIIEVFSKIKKVCTDNVEDANVLADAAVILDLSMVSNIVKSKQVENDFIILVCDLVIHLCIVGVGDAYLSHVDILVEKAKSCTIDALCYVLVGAEFLLCDC